MNLSKEEKEGINFTEKDIERLRKVKVPFPKITYDTAIEILELSFGSDISSRQEQRLIKDAHTPTKILSVGKMTKALNIQVQAVSKQARVKIEKAGGKVELLKRVEGRE